MKKSTKRDKQNYIEALAQEAEEAAGENNLKELYMTTKKLAESLGRPTPKSGTNRDDSLALRKNTKDGQNILKICSNL